MVGAQINDVRADEGRRPGEPRLVVDRLSAASPSQHGVSLKNVSLTVRAGEVVGVAGVAGNGQSELFACLSGELIADRPDAIYIDGHAVGDVGVHGRRARRAVFVPEERNGHAAAPDFSLSENVVLTSHGKRGMTRGGFIVADRALAKAAEVVAAFDVRKSGFNPLARTLSGGNLQKFVVGREILAHPGVFVVNQPTWGVDALASAAIRQALLDLSAQGVAVLAISQDLDELFEICDRLVVIHGGRLSAPRETRATTREAIGLLMTGMGEDEHAG
jgi:simple sugar transport system ATP-binding protein